MFHKLLAIVLFVTLVFAIERPKNYWAGNAAPRGDQQQVNQFAAFNITSKNWNVVIPPGISRASIRGLVAVGTGYLAYGSFTSLGSSVAAGLAYYDGQVWSVPEGVGLYTYDQTSKNPAYLVPPTSVGTAYAAVVDGNDVYVYGSFNQVGLRRGGVAGFVKLTWSAGGIFTIGTVGNAYSQTVAGVCSSFCPGDANPSGTKNKLMTYLSNSVRYFILQDTADLWSFTPNSASWNRISSSNGARNLQGNIADFDVNSGSIYAVGKFDNTNDANPQKQYLHIAVSPDGGNTWNTVSSPQPLNVNNFASLSPTYNPVDNSVIYQGLDCIGLTAISVQSSSSIFVAGGWRDTDRNITTNNLAGQMQMRVFQISGATITPISERFGSSSTLTAAVYGTFPEFLLQKSFINRLMFANGVLYTFGTFDVYQLVVTTGTRFTHRYVQVMKGAAQYSNNQWSQAFGGWLTTSATGDVSSTFVANAWNTRGDVAYFLATFAGNDVLSSYNLVSGSIFAYGGDEKRNQDHRWNAVLSNQRFTSSSAFNYGSGNVEGYVRTLHMTKKGDALIFGGLFDWVGTQRVSGAGWYSYDQNTVYSLGGGLYEVTSSSVFGADNYGNYRFGGVVWDFEEVGDYLYAGGVFNRNNSGNALFNVAKLKFRQNGAGWEQLDGGCDKVVRDLLAVGNLLYATGDFQYCGLITDSYKGSIVRGRVPHSYISVIDLGQKNPSWRNLGVGLSGPGYAMAYRNGDLFVGGSFSNAGGLLYTSGIARWRGDHWVDVLAACRGDCDGRHNVRPFVTSRIPDNCYNLREFNGLIYCASSTGVLAYFDSNTWFQAGTVSPSSQYGSVSNTLLSRNATHSDYILYHSTSTASVYISNGANLATYNNEYKQAVPTYGGFSQNANAISNANSLIASALLLIAVLFVSYF